MVRISVLVQHMRANPSNIPYSDLLRVCTHYFGAPRMTGGSHAVFKTPRKGDPRINIQQKKGMAKPYQVKQVLKALQKLEDENVAQ